MEQITSSWNTLDFRKKIVAIGATVAMFAALFFMAQYAAKPSMSLLYANLDDAAASDVISALEQRGIEYDVRGSAIYVPQTRKDALRLELAGDGLPNNGPRGYELLDSLSGFGTTSQMFDAAYWRAKEGELARTILANPAITSARVHIAQQSSSPFSREQESTASVFVTSTSGRPESDAIRAIQHLVASAVPNLDPNSVSILDDQGLLTAQEPETAATNAAVDLSALMKERVTRLLEARVGQGNVVVEVSVDTNTQTEQITERRFDPDGRVAISVDTEERTRNSEGGNAGLSVSSNLPDGEAGGAGGSTTADTETRERVNYEISETTREISRLPGDIERLTVAALINGVTTTGADGTSQFTPLPDEELQALSDLIASAIGFEEARGDLITIHSLQFDEVQVEGTTASQLPWYSTMLDIGSIAKLLFSGLVALVIGLTVLRPILKSPPAQLAQDPAGLVALDESLPPMQEDDPFEFAEAAPDLPMLVTEASVFDPEISLEEAGDGDPTSRLKTLIDSRKDETIEIIGNWLDARVEAET